MKKYGLQLRVPPSQQKKTAARPPLPPPLGFHNDDEDDVEEQHKKALEEDPSVFDYDGVYDEMKEKVVRPRIQDCEERKLVKEGSKEDHLYEDKDKFVTGAYKKKLAEQAKWMEEERLCQLLEEKDDTSVIPESNVAESSGVAGRPQDEKSSRENYESQDSKPVKNDILPETAVKETSGKQPSVDQPQRDHHKRGEDAVAAARERFLARKRAKEQ
ncbi:hypothetical protein DITRI_Ditri18aG0067800 [Diplodiscus trichospermus]